MGQEYDAIVGKGDVGNLLLNSQTVSGELSGALLERLTAQVMGSTPSNR